jgi:hypothetical protein
VTATCGAKEQQTQQLELRINQQHIEEKEHEMQTTREVLRGKLWPTDVHGQ